MNLADKQNFTALMWAAYFGNDMLILVILSDIITRLMGML